MNFSDILGLGSIAMNLFAGLSRQNIYRKQENSYLQQAALNRQIGAFNAEVSERTGTQNMYAIVDQTKRLLGEQINTVTNRGISLSGSPMFVLGDTKTMGERQVQEAYFNAQVSKINHEYASYGATQAAVNYAQDAKYGQYGAILDTVRGVSNGFDLLKSMFKSSPLNSNPVFGGTNSTIGKMMGSIFS